MSQNIETITTKLKRWPASVAWGPGVSIPLAVVAAYCGALLLVLQQARKLPAGVNLAFVNALWPWLLAGSAIALGIALALRQKPLAAASESPAAAWRPTDWLLLLLPLAPVVQYLLNNTQQVSFPQNLFLLLAFLAVSVLLVVALPKLLSRFADPAVLRILSVIFLFMITNMAVLSASFLWFAEGDLRIQLGIMLALIVLFALLYPSRHRNLLLLLVTAFFVSNTVAQVDLGKQIPVSLDIHDHPLFSAVPVDPETKPNIYLLVYDSYVANETMLQYGIDNSEQELYLQQHGFTMYPHNYSIGSYSVVSIGSLMNASLDFYGDTRIGTSGAGVVHQIFQRMGYRTYGYFASDFFFQEVGSSYDVSFPQERPASLVLLDSILLGEFRFDIGFDASTAKQFEQQKLDLFGDVPADPVFLYAHSYAPGHSQNSGECLPNETKLFEQRLAVANVEMRTDLDLLLANDPTAIVIVAGDHGPYLSKNCYATGRGGYTINDINRFDIQDRFGSFLAIRWPEGAQFEAYDEITVLQDLYPAILAYMHQDASILQYRVPPVTMFYPEYISDAAVDNGIIQGGKNDGEPLFLSQP
ncbi:MAG: hypothetical protein KF701_08270 [Anaerolineales bacterium]|nr:MAG: hypothetical protein KF701_08270 [Anaerolineales bacterium]